MSNKLVTKMHQNRAKQKKNAALKKAANMALGLFYFGLLLVVFFYMCNYAEISNKSL